MVWDEVVAANMLASGLRCSSATRVATGLPGTGPKPGAEPLVDLLLKTQRDLALRVGRVFAFQTSQKACIRLSFANSLQRMCCVLHHLIMTGQAPVVCCGADGLCDTVMAAGERCCRHPSCGMHSTVANNCLQVRMAGC